MVSAFTPTRPPPNAIREILSTTERTLSHLGEVPTLAPHCVWCSTGEAVGVICIHWDVFYLGKDERHRLKESAGTLYLSTGDSSPCGSRRRADAYRNGKILQPRGALEGVEQFAKLLPANTCTERTLALAGSARECGVGNLPNSRRERASWRGIPSDARCLC